MKRFHWFQRLRMCSVAMAVVIGTLTSPVFAQDGFYDDAFYGDEYAGDDDQNVGQFGYDDWTGDADEDGDNRYEYPYSTTAATSGGNNNTWWESNPYYNEDEWYDPTDWFDGNNYEYDAADSVYDTSSAKDGDGDDFYYGNDSEYGDDLYDYGYYNDPPP